MNDLLDNLKFHATELIGSIEARPRTNGTLGPWLKQRLCDQDWIKSLDLLNFTRRLTDEPDLFWKPDLNDLAHVTKQLAKFDADATSLDAFEHILEAFEQCSLEGINNWFSEIGGEAGYWLDKRIHSAAWEMFAIASVFEWAKVSKLRRSNKTRVPDYFIDMGSLGLVVECKTLFGRPWPLVVLRTVARSLRRLGGVNDTDETMFVVNYRARVQDIEQEIAALSIEETIQRVSSVAHFGIDEPLSPNIIIKPRSKVARRLGLHASYLDLETDDDFDREFAIWTPSQDAIRREAITAWSQCENWVAPSSIALRFDTVAIMAEAWPGHPDLSNNQALLREWLTREVWPTSPNRVLMAQFGDIFKPVWFVSPEAMESLNELNDTAASREALNAP